MTEDEDLLAKIGQVAGQINQHRNQASSRPSSEKPSYAPYHSQSTRSRGWAPYRGRGRPARRPMASHRNRTLVLNNNQGGNSENPTASTSTRPSSENVEEMKPISSSGWVAKRDRHMQLINPIVYDKESQARVKAIEESLRMKAQKKTEREEAQVIRHAQGVGSRQPTVSASQAPGGGGPRSTSYQLIVDDIPFQVVKGGSKLIRVSSETSHLPRHLFPGASLPLLDDPTTAGTTPKRVKVGGVDFVRSKKGNLHRVGAVASKRFVANQQVILVATANRYLLGERRTGKVKKKNELCKRFTTTGSCHKGPSCPYIHDAKKVAICKSFLQTGECDAGMACDLSHDPTPERSPVCVHFLRGRCSNPECRYAHIRVTPGAPVCREFATLGYCDKGADCNNRHVHECPDYANTGICGNKKCKLPHVDRAGQIRKYAANKAASPETMGDEDDISSDEDDYEEIDSDDVDSDELEDDPMEITEGDSGEISQQQDFVGF
ncbi:hypothetical protein FQN54_003428 [Arachnomyces sp. PD_36]|nr:hypothetical protein FQN54_003428 [Arachnomyces sp. PD_36]